MERESHEHSKVVKLLEKIPSWVQLLITIGTLVFGFGVMYGTQQDMKSQLYQLREVPLVNSRQDADIRNLRQQLVDNKETQIQTNSYISKLADAISSLSSSVARLEGKLDAEDKRRRK